MVLAVLALDDREIGKGVEHRGARLVAHRRVAEAHAQRLALARHAAMADVLLAQRAARFGGEALDALGDRRLHVDLQQEVHPAAQVEPEVHGQRAHRGEPVGRGRQQVERDDVGRVLRVGVERAVDHVARLELGVGVGEPHAHAGRIEDRAGVLDLFF
jgi:hypothetical protein